MDSNPVDPAAQLTDELRGAVEELSSVAHDPAAQLADELRGAVEELSSVAHDPAAQLADELRGAIEELSSVAHDPERVARAVTMAADLRTFLDGPKAPRWYEASRVDGHLDEISAAAFNNQSLYRGTHNPLAPPMTMALVEDDEGRRIEARVRLNVAYEGPPHGVHGGYVAGMFDEVLGATQRMMAKPGVTGRLTVHYRHITPIEEDLLLKAWITEDVGRRIVAKATCHAGDTLTAEADGLFIRVDFEEVADRMAARRDGGSAP